MRRLFIIIGIGFFLAGCAHWFSEPYPDLVETEKQLVSGCAFLAIVSETADGGNPFMSAAELNMVLKVRERAGQLGATHIVWLHKTATMATAEAYQCR